MAKTQKVIAKTLQKGRDGTTWHCGNPDEVEVCKSGDFCFYTEHLEIYKCVTGGVAGKAVWEYVCSLSQDFSEHIKNTSNPHSVTAKQVGLGNVPNVTTNDQTPTYTESSSLTNLVSGEKLSVAFGKIKKATTDLIAHLANTSNPHKVTASQVGAAAESHTHAELSPKQAVYYSGITGDPPDIDTITDALMLIPIQYSKDCPVGGSFVYIAQFFYGGVNESNLRTQIAFPYATKTGTVGSGIATRSYKGEGVWTEWDYLGTGDIEIPLPITAGGTGATTVEDALVNLGLSTIVTPDTISNSKFTLDENGLDLTPITGAAWFANQVIGSLYLTGRLIDVVLVGADPYGKEDSSVAIQDALERAHDLSGAIVFFPTGTYRLDNCVYYPSNVTLLFAPGATLLRGRANLRCLLSNYVESTATGYDGTENVRIIGATFDGNSDFYTSSTNDNKVTLLLTKRAKNISVENCTFKNGNVWHLYEVNAAENVKIINCIFDGSNYGGTPTQVDGYAELLQLDNDYIAEGTVSETLVTSGDLTPCKKIYIQGCEFICNGYTNAIGNHNPQTYNHSLIRIYDCFFKGGGGTGGYIDFDSSTIEVDIYNNSFDGNAITITASNSKVTVHDNRIENASSPYTGNLTAYCNLIGGVLDSASSDGAFEDIDFTIFGTMRTGNSTYGYANLESYNIKKYKGRIMGVLKFSDVTTNEKDAFLPVMVNEGYRPKLTSACWAEVNNSGNSATGVGYLSSGSDTLRITFSKSLSSANNVTVFFDYAV